MNISHNQYDAIENLIFNEGLKITSLDISPTLDNITLHLSNDLSFIVPVGFYKGLRNASMERLMNYKLIASGTGVHWPDLDEDLSLKGFLNEFLRQKVNTERELVIS
jgi:hypothetical protein